MFFFVFIEARTKTIEKSSKAQAGKKSEGKEWRDKWGKI